MTFNSHYSKRSKMLILELSGAFLGRMMTHTLPQHQEKSKSQLRYGRASQPLKIQSDNYTQSCLRRTRVQQH